MNTRNTKSIEDTIERHDRAALMRRSGKTYAEIGRAFGGISREAVHQLITGPLPKKSLPPGMWMTVAEVARLIHVHENTVRRWANKGVLKAHRLGTRGDRRFLRDEVTVLLTGVQHQVDSHSPVLEVTPSRRLSDMSAVELDVLQLAALGYSMKEIASGRHTSTSTSKNQASSIRRKLGANNITHAVAIGLKTGIIV